MNGKNKKSKEIAGGGAAETARLRRIRMQEQRYSASGQSTA